MHPLHTPYLFDEFFASGKEESISPFLTPSSRPWGKNLALKGALLAALFLAAAFSFSFVHSALSNLFLVGAYFFAGTRALIDTLEDIKNIEINIDVLMTLAALLSVLIGSGMEGALLLVLFELSGAMEETVMQKTKSALSSLNQLSPRTAYVIEEGGAVIQRSVKEIDVGTSLLVKAGEIVPLDGIVIQGSSYVNLVHLTGESQPIPKLPGHEVQAGARNLDGTLTIRVTKTSEDSTLSRIVQLITQAQEAKPRLQRFLDRFGKKYALTIIGLSLLFALTLPWLFSLPYLGKEGGIYRALTFLIAASPCALIIATPTAYLSAISSCAKKGILLKGGAILDAVASCSTIAFDKTGTLTTGKLSCTSLESIQGSYDRKMAIGIAAALERHAVHPVAEAISNYAKQENAPAVEIEAFRSIPGFGLEGTFKGKPVFIGHADYILSKLPAKTTLEPGTYLLIDGALFLFHFTDTLRPKLAALMQLLKAKEKMRLVMLTGDHTANALEVGKSLGIDEVFAELRPEDKLTKVEKLSLERGLMMIGDGINDAPALARATVGISMGKIGSATAVDASDIVLLQDDLFLLDWLIPKARKTLTIVKQNLTLALIVILFATTPALLGWVPLWVAVILHEGGTVLVGLNSLRLIRQ